MDRNRESFLNTVERSPRPHVLNDLAVVPVAEHPANAIVPLAPTVLPPAPRAINRETLAHGLITLATLTGAGTIATLSSAPTTLVALATAVAASVAILTTKLMGGGGKTQAQLLQALATERAALSAAQQHLTAQGAAMAGDRARLASESAELSRARAELDDRIATKAAQLVAVERQEIAAERGALAEERNALEALRAGLETKRSAVGSAIAAELDALTQEELGAIRKAIEDITADHFGSKQGYTRFFADVVPAHGHPRSEHAPLTAAAALATLVSRGTLFVGRAQYREAIWVGCAAETTALKSIADLRHYLRAFTGRQV